MDREVRMSIQDLVDEAKAHDCNLGIIAVQTGKDTYAIELRISKGGYHVSRTLSPEDISQAKIDVIAFEFNVMIDKLETALAERQ